MANRRIHLALSIARVACGTPLFTRSTRALRYVTCQACQRSLAMADAEHRQQQQPRV